MNFVEAVKAMKEGKKVRRNQEDWKPDDVKGRMYEFCYIEKGKLVFGSTLREIHCNCFLDSEDFESTDWEIVDDTKNGTSDKDWNLAEEEVTPAGNFSYDDVKKCRDLILEDIDKETEHGSSIQYTQRQIWNDFIKQIIKQRFGDL